MAGDSLPPSAASGTFADNNAGTSKAVVVAVAGNAMRGADAGNNTLGATGTRTQASITPRTLHGSATGAGREYDGGAAARVALADGHVAGDSLALTASASFVDKSASVAKIVNMTGLGMSGNDAGNQALDTEPVSARASVAPRASHVTAVAAERTADGTTGADVTFRDDRLAGDRLSVSGGSVQFADAAAGKDKTVSITGIGLAGADAGNHRLAGTSSTAMATILPGAVDDQPATVIPVVPETPAAPASRCPAAGHRAERASHLRGNPGAHVAKSLRSEFISG